LVLVVILVEVGCSDVQSHRQPRPAPPYDLFALTSSTLTPRPQCTPIHLPLSFTRSTQHSPTLLRCTEHIVVHDCYPPPHLHRRSPPTHPTPRQSTPAAPRLLPPVEYHDHALTVTFKRRQPPLSVARPEPRPSYLLTAIRLPANPNPQPNPAHRSPPRVYPPAYHPRPRKPTATPRHPHTPTSTRAQPNPPSPLLLPPTLRAGHPLQQLWRNPPEARATTTTATNPAWPAPPTRSNRAPASWSGSPTTGPTSS